jgi:hypothetical protein
MKVVVNLVRKSGGSPNVRKTASPMINSEMRKDLQIIRDNHRTSGLSDFPTTISNKKRSEISFLQYSPKPTWS